MTISRNVAVDRASAIPLYQQIADYFSEEIRSGRLAPGASLGSEGKLQRQFGVSRVTLRQAIGILVDRQMVVRRQGKGTFVEAVPLHMPLEILAGTTETARKLGRVTRSSVLSWEETTDDSQIADLLNNGDSNVKKTHVTKIVRLDFAGEQALAVATIFLPIHVADSLDKTSLESEPLYPLLEAAGITIDEAHETIRFGPASLIAKQELDLQGDGYAVLVNRITTDKDGNVLEYSIVEFPPSSVEFAVTLRRRLTDKIVPTTFSRRLLTSTRATMTSPERHNDY